MSVLLVYVPQIAKSFIWLTAAGRIHVSGVVQ